MTEAEKFAHRIQECAQNKESITVFGVNYVLEEDYDTAVLASLLTARENARLRELLAELASTTVLCQNGECNNCQFGNPTGFGCTWDNYIHELGIEVD